MKVLFESVTLTLQAVSIEQVFALLMALDAALCAADALPRQAPQQPLALEAVRRGRGRPHEEVVRRRRADRVDERLQRLLVHVLLLQGKCERIESTVTCDRAPGTRGEHVTCL